MTPNDKEQKIDAVLSALANPIRRQLLERLLTNENLSANDLAAGIELSRSSVSEHLSLLERSRLVTAEKVGRQRLYRLSPEEFMPVMQYLEMYRSFWEVRMQKLREHLGGSGHVG